MKTQAETQRFVAAATKVYNEKLKESLERDHLGEIVAIEPESGEYLLGRTLDEVALASRQRFAPKLVHMFRVGGGGAVRIGGARRGRVS